MFVLSVGKRASLNQALGTAVDAVQGWQRTAGKWKAMARA
jgi:hypothetical protein